MARLESLNNLSPFSVTRLASEEGEPLPHEYTPGRHRYATTKRERRSPCRYGDGFPKSNSDDDEQFQVLEGQHALAFHHHQGLRILHFRWEYGAIGREY